MQLRAGNLERRAAEAGIVNHQAVERGFGGAFEVRLARQVAAGQIA